MTYPVGGKSVFFALLGNIFVTFIKTAVAFATGSASMFAESVHSLADTLNQSLLLIGLKRSRKPADKRHGYGHGIERFFWSLISACGILFVGAGITLYHSISSLIYRTGTYRFHIESIIVLLVSLAVESSTFRIALKELRSNMKPSQKLFEDVDPVTLAVIYEDGAAVIGVFFALLAQLLAYLTKNSLYDSVGGILVGLVLGFLAIVLIIKNYHYIVGKPIREETKEEIIELLLADPCIEKIIDFKSVAVDIGKYRIYATVEWNGTPLYEEIYESGDLREEFDNVKNDFKEFTKLMFKTTDRIPRLVGTRIDNIEKRIREKFPEIRYIDIEIN